MKSNQERSNGCLPPKKREILALEQKPMAVAAAASPVVSNDGPHTENLAWLASVASERCRSRDAEILRCPVVPAPPSSSSSSTFSLSSSSVTQPVSSVVYSSAAVPLASLPAVYSQQHQQQQQAGTTIQYAQLAPNVQFISSGPYTGYISSHIVPSSSAAGDGYTATLVSSASKVEQHHHHHQQQFQIGLSPADLAAVSLSTSSTQVTSGSHQYIHLDGGTPLTVSSPSAAHHHHLPLQLHHHHHPPATATAILPHTLTLAPSQLLVQYATEGLAPAKKAEGGSGGKAALLNGGEVELVKQCKVPGQQQQPVQSYEARHILLPAEYGTQNPTLVLVAQPNTGTAELDPLGSAAGGPNHNNNNKLSLLHAAEKGGICLGKPVSRASSFSSPGEALKPPGGPPHAVLQAEELPVGLYSSGQPPIIGYITGTGHHHHQHAVSYHATLPQHLVMSGGQSLLIPVSSGSAVVSNSGQQEAEVSHAAHHPAPAPHISTAMPHAYLATALSKCEVLGSELHPQTMAVAAQAQAQAPLAPPPPADPPAAHRHPSHALAPASVQPSPSLSSSAAAPAVSSNSTSSSPVALPPFFMRGSIIQLADGELKRVEDLKTEDFIQSAEISSELKIDSSTVERIDSGQTPNAVVIQFAVGELKAQVCVEVLLEYPFFVFGQGWSSCCPDRTTQLFELSCAKLCVGDVCVSLTLRGIRNGSVTAGGQPPGVGLKAGGHQPSYSPHAGTEPAVRNSSSPHAAGGNNGLLMKAGSDRLGPHPVLASDVVYGGVQRRQGPEAAKADRPPPADTRQAADADRPPSGRKRRWSAPERDQTERAEEEPPPALPKPSFIPQEVKICIEGRSSIGI